MRGLGIALLLAVTVAAGQASAGTIYNVERGPGIRSLAYGAEMPVVVAGPVFDGLSPEALAGLLRGRDRLARTRFVAAGPEARSGLALVLSFGRADGRGLCSGPITGGAAPDIVAAAVCLNGEAVASATMRRGRSVERDFNELLHRMVTRRPRGSRL